MGELGLLGVPWPEEFGGAGLDLLSYMIVIKELAKVDASHGLTMSAHTTLGTSPIVHFGTDDAEAALRPAARDRPRARRVRAHGTRRGQRRRGHADDRRSQRGSLRPERHQAIHHAWRRRRDLRRHGGDRSAGRGTNGISSFILTKHTNDLESRGRGGRRARAIAAGDAGFPRRQEGGQARLARIGHRRADHGGRRGPGREPARQGRARAS